MPSWHSGTWVVKGGSGQSGRLEHAEVALLHAPMMTKTGPSQLRVQTGVSCGCPAGIRGLNAVLSACCLFSLRWQGCEDGLYVGVKVSQELEQLFLTLSSCRDQRAAVQSCL